MPSTAEAPAPIRGEQIPLSAPLMMESRRQDRSTPARLLPLLGACGLVGVAAMVPPSLPVGLAILGGEVALGGFTLFMLWPRNK